MAGRASGTEGGGAPVDGVSSAMSVANLEKHELPLEEEPLNTVTVPTTTTKKKDGMKVVSNKRNTSLQSRKRRQNFSPAMATASKRPAIVQPNEVPRSTITMPNNESYNSLSTEDKNPAQCVTEESLEEKVSAVTLGSDASYAVPPTTKQATATNKNTKKDTVKSDAVNTVKETIKSDVVMQKDTEVVKKENSKKDTGVVKKRKYTKRNANVKVDNPRSSRRRIPSFSPARHASPRISKVVSPPDPPSSQEHSEEFMEDDDEYQETTSIDTDAVFSTTQKDAKKATKSEGNHSPSRKYEKKFSPARADSSSPVRCAGFKNWANGIKAHLSQFYCSPSALESDDEHDDVKAIPSPPKKKKLKPSCSKLSEKELDRYMFKIWGDDSNEELSDTESDDGLVNEILELKHFYNRKLRELQKAYKRKMNGLADIAEVVPLCAQQKGLKEYISKGKEKIRSLDKLRLELKRQVADTLDDLLSFRCNLQDKVYSKPRLPAGATRILSKWYLDHSRYPYPTHREKAEMAKRCKIKTELVTQWFVNRRRSAKQAKGMAKRKPRARASSTKKSKALRKVKAHSYRKATAKHTKRAGKKTAKPCRKTKDRISSNKVKNTSKGSSKQPRNKAKN